MKAPMSADLAQAFRLGSVVVPARNGTLAGLGFDVGALQERALGLVTESRPQKCFVLFPELSLWLWLPKSELADVEFEAQGRAEYQALLPDFEKNPPAIWWLWKARRDLEARFFLGFEKGSLASIWNEREGPLGEHYQGVAAEEAALYAGFGVDELRLERWERLRHELGSRLLFARFLPAGLHKIEVALYLRDEASAGAEARTRPRGSSTLSRT